ncbi:MAG: sigma 54 modulation/S30EA ribosomal C-terminal domain-containing protein, partial [Clostridia bacterium]|nr:sigma 54 modulation/S30EA ribosomal C-terminal domain-containing protein [Clostridia bacterium]
FHIFLNNKTGKVNVLYKRRAGNLGCIELDY